jgi:hypothetical protein
MHPQRDLTSKHGRNQRADQHAKVVRGWLTPRAAFALPCALIPGLAGAGRTPSGHGTQRQRGRDVRQMRQALRKIAEHLLPERRVLLGKQSQVIRCRGCVFERLQRACLRRRRARERGRSGTRV